MSKLLSPEMLKAVGAYTSSLEETVVLRLNIGEHDKKDELREFLGDLASTSDMLNLEEKRLDLENSGPLTFQVCRTTDNTGIFFFWNTGWARI